MSLARELPRLRRSENAVELLVLGKPFVILGGELSNSLAANPTALAAAWPRLLEMRLNTALLPVYWELCEPVEGRFDFSALDSALEGARRHGLHLVLLWFGSFKNSMSCYAPSWLKRDAERFPRSRLASGLPLEMLSVFSSNNLDADRRAFRALMRHLRVRDEQHRTVLMVQVENEVAMVDQARDHEPKAERAFSQAVPYELCSALQKTPEQCHPQVLAAYQSNGARKEGSWREVFGDAALTDELFMAWHYARYVNAVAAAGKAEYRVPMFTNAALNAPGKQPGEYPSAGPLPHLFDVWKLGAPELDFLSPDIYFDNFADWCSAYARPNNPLFIPEAKHGKDAAAHALYAIAEHNALGFCPFAIDAESQPATAPLGQAYNILRSLAAELTQARSDATRRVRAVLLDDAVPQTELTLGGTLFHLRHESTWNWGTGFEQHPYPRAAALLIAEAPNVFLVAGAGVLVTMPPQADGEHIGIESAELLEKRDGEWVTLGWLNGDQTHQGRHLHLPLNAMQIQRLRLYRYR